MKETSLTNEQLVLNTIINNIPAMVFYKNLDGKYIAANEMFARQLNTTPREIIGKTDFDFYSEEIASHYRDTDLEVIQSGKNIEALEEAIVVDGVTKMYATRKVLLRDTSGKPYGIIGLAYDITESRQSQEDLLDSHTRYKYLQEMFRLMADNIPDLLWAKDMRKRYLFVNKALCENLLNASDTDEPIGKTDMFFAERERKSHPEDPQWHTFGETCSDSDELTMQQKSAGKYEEFGNVKGQFLYLDVQKGPILDKDGNMIGTVGSGRDITSQKLIEKEFHALLQRNRAIINALPDLMFIFNKEGIYLDCYASDTTDLLASPEEFIGKSMFDFFEPEVAENTILLINRCLETEKLQHLEYHIQSGTEILYYEARLVKVDDEKVLCISRNITERKLLQQELILAKEKAEQTSRLKSTLLNNMSHELRTPLNGILGFSEILGNELEELEHKEMSVHINNSGKRLMRTLESIMQLSQLESGLNAYKAEWTDVAQKVNELIGSFRPLAKAKNLFLELRNVDVKPGYLDIFFFTQSISNIIENAIKFTNEGGVSIDISESSENNHRSLLIRISDTGIGISDDHLKLIFEEFRQASEGQNRSFEGTGLGLTIAKKMIDLLGGKIVVESRLGKGSLFNITIPYSEMDTDQVKEKKCEPHDITPRTDLQMQANKTPHLLLVEDNEINMQLSLAYLKNSYKVDWALDGQTAIHMAGGCRYDAILMDVNLGTGMDGLQTTQMIRSLEGYEKTPIIALTGYTLFGDRDRLIAGGCTEYLAKPFTKRAILDLLNGIFNRTD